MATATGGSFKLWLTLLFISLGVTLTDTQKSVMSLNPPWIRIFTGDKVTLSCHGNNSLQENSTKWFHNGIISKVTTSHWDITSATIQDSGKYVCQKQGLYKSKPVYLEVMRDWLLLQTSADTVLDNESFDIRCYGWKNWSLHKVIYYKNDLAFKYFYESPTISIRNAKLNDSGTYHCTGYLRRLNYTSEKFRITVIKVYKSKYHWLQLIVPLLVVILFAVDTWLLVSTEKQFKLVLKIQKTGKHNKP
ncbi:high affinity immunoglobulin epsilon receptor subunit alpha-like protein [Cricetulus griseus]|nr:high affinity immunoglobulin epsilon receptor subunit alpha-like protein [Cricetulus griseus]